MKCGRIGVWGCVFCVLVCGAVARADDPYAYNFNIQPGSHVDFTMSQYNGYPPSGSPIDSWSGSSAVSGTMSAAMWQTSAGTFSHIQMNDVDIYGDSTIGPTDWFYVGTNLGDTRMKGQVENLNIKDNNVPGAAPIVGGQFNVPDFQAQAYGTMKVYAQYKLFFAWVNVPGYYPYSENLADHNDPPPNGDLPGSVSGSLSSPVLTTNQQMQQVINFDELEQDPINIDSGSMVVDFDSSITANTVGGATLLLHADAGANTAVHGSYANGTLDASGSYDPQSNVITSYEWDLNGDGVVDKTGSTSSLTDAELAAMGLAYGEHVVDLTIVADDGYWATDEVTLTYLPSIPGDANIDGAVDVSDLGILATNYGLTSGAEWLEGDYNLDGKVDVSDLGILATKYGTTATGTPVQAPEPATLSLLGVGAIALLRRNRKN